MTFRNVFCTLFRFYLLSQKINNLVVALKMFNGTNTSLLHRHFYYDPMRSFYAKPFISCPRHGFAENDSGF